MQQHLDLMKEQNAQAESGLNTAAPFVVVWRFSGRGQTPNSQKGSSRAV
jgi:hypothetical protein